MNGPFQRTLVALAEERSRDHPADVERALQRGMDRYRSRIHLAYGVVVAAAVVLVGLLIMAYLFEHETKPTDITFASYELTLPLNTQAQLYVDGVYRDGIRPLPAESITWSSDHQDVAAVDSATGEVRGLSPGEAAITASAYGITKQVRVTVTKAKLESIEVKGPDKVEQGKEGSFTAEGKFSDGTTGQVASATWNSSKPAIAKVDAKTGKVTGESPGETTITATSEGIEDSAKVAIIPATRPPTGSPTGSVHPTLVDIKIDGPNSVTVGNPEPYSAIGVYSNHHEEELPAGSVEWQSSDPTVATIDTTGVVTGVISGEVTITASRSDVSGNKPLHVVPPSPTCSPPSVNEAAYLNRPVDEVAAHLAGEYKVEPRRKAEASDQVDAGNVFRVIPECIAGDLQITIFYSSGPAETPTTETPIPTPPPAAP